MGRFTAWLLLIAARAGARGAHLATTAPAAPWPRRLPQPGSREGASAVRGFWHGIRAIHLGSGSKSVPNTQLELEKKLLDCEDGRTLAALVASTGEHGLPPREAAAALSRLAELVEEGTTGEAEAREALSTMWRSGATAAARGWVARQLQEAWSLGHLFGLVETYHAALDGPGVALALLRAAALGAGLEAFTGGSEGSMGQTECRTSPQGHRQAFFLLHRILVRHASSYTTGDLAAAAWALACLREQRIRTSGGVPANLASPEELEAVEMLAMQVAVRARAFSGEDLIDAVGSLLYLGCSGRLLLRAAAAAARRRLAEADEENGSPRTGPGWRTIATLRQLERTCEFDTASRGDSEAPDDERSLGLLCFTALWQDRSRWRTQGELNRLMTQMSDPSELLRFIRLRHLDFDGVCVATALLRLARTGYRVANPNTSGSTHEIAPLLGLLEARAATYSGRVLSNAIHALAQIGCPGHIHAVSVLAQRLKDRAGDLTTPELVAAASGMANLGRSGNGDSQAFWDALADEALRRGTEGVGDQALPARAAANLLWALATSGCIKRRGDTAAAVTSAFLADVGSARPQELSMAAWAMAKGHAKDALSMETLAAILEAAVPFLKPSNGRSSAREDAGINQRGWLTRSISDSLGSSPARPEGGRGGDRFNSQGLAILVWAAASLDHPLSQPFLRAVCAEAEAQAEGFTPQGYAMLLWGLVTTSSSSCSQVADEVVQLFECLSPSVCRAADSFQVPDISMLLYSYAMLGLEEQDLFRVLGRRLLSLLEDSKADPASPVDLATAAWALGAAGHHDHELLHVLGREAVRRRTDLSSNGLCMFAWAFATLGYSSPALFGAVRDELERGNPSCSLFDGQGLPNILWALAVAGELKPTTAVAVQAQVADLLGSGQAPSQAVLSQLFAAELSLKAFSHQRLLLKDSDLWIQARKAWSRGHDSVGPSSRVLSEAARLISSMGLDSRLSVTTEDGDIKVPLACLPAMMDKVAVEFYWRSSCTSSKPRRLLGRAMLRRRLLEARGWTVVGIMSHEWQPPPSIADNDAAVSAFRRGVLQKKLWFALQTIVT